MVKALPAVAALVATLAPKWVLACPVCAGRDDGNGTFTLVALGLMILFPFATVAVVLGVLRRAARDDNSNSSDGALR